MGSLMVSLQTGGELASAGSTVSMPIGVSLSSPKTASIAAEILTIGNQVVTAKQTAIAVAGTTISASGPGITASGKVVSLGGSGGLVVDGSTIAVPSTNYSAAPTTTISSGKASKRGRG